MEKQVNMPRLRFPEFEGEWVNRKLDEVADVSSGGTPSRSNLSYWNGNIPWISTNQIDFITITDADEKITESGLRNSSAKIFPKGTLLMAMYGQGKTRGKVALLGIDASTNQACGAIIPNDKFICSSYLFHNLVYRYYEIRNMSNQGGQENLSGTIIKSIELTFPTISEQTRISTFLFVVDDLISQKLKKKNLLSQYKKGVMQQLFSQELRFKDEEGNDFADWEIPSLGDICQRITRKNKENNLNVLTISAQNGLINQEDYFNKSVSAKDVTGYYLMHKDDFAYNKSYSAGYPMGAIKRLKRYEKGVVSTLYICFRFSNSVDFSYMEQYFESGLHNPEIEKVAQEGARNHGLLNIGVNDFFNTNLILPSLPEQQKIASFLTYLDTKIAQTSLQIEKMQLWKKGLLQQMFV